MNVNVKHHITNKYKLQNKLKDTMPGRGSIHICPYYNTGCEFIYIEGTETLNMVQMHLKHYHGEEIMKPKPLSQLAEGRMVSIIKTCLSDRLSRWVEDLSGDGPVKQENKILLQIEQDIRKVLSFLQDPSILPQCFTMIQGIKRDLESIAEECKNIRTLK